MQKILDLPEVISSVNSDIRVYLTSAGILSEAEVSKKFRCLNPEHNDNSPSMAVTPDARYVKCFGCGVHWDTLHLHSVTNDLGTTGEDFIQAVKEVAEILDLHYDLSSPRPEDIKKAKQHALYQKIGFLLTDRAFDPSSRTDAVKTFVKDRGWADPSIAAEFGIGTLTQDTLLNEVAAGNIFQQEFAEHGGTAKGFLESNDLYREGAPLFSTNGLIIPLHDVRGNPSGFAVRNTTWEKGASFGKWVNTSVHQTLVYDKKGSLFNYHRAKAFIKANRKNDLFVVEGQGDVISLHAAGIKNAVACCTSHLSEEQVDLLNRSGASNINLLFDGDDAGTNGVYDSLTNYYHLLKGVSLFVYQLPAGEDPDSYVRANGQEAIYKLPKVPGFDWLLQKLSAAFSNNFEKIAKSMIPIIATFESAIAREKLARRLSETTDFRLETILEEVRSITDRSAISRNTLIQDTVRGLTNQIQRDPDNAASIIKDALGKVEQIDHARETDHFTGSFFADQILGFREMNEANSTKFPGFNMPLMPGFAQAFDNDWSAGKMINFGGDENVGKTSFSCFLAYNLCHETAENNLRTMYMTIDDSVQEIYVKFICIAGRHLTKGQRGYPNGFPLMINHIVQPNYWKKVLGDIDPKLADDMEWAYNLGYNEIMNMAKRDILTVFGVPYAKDLKDFKRGLQLLRRKYPADNIFAYLDNIHKLPIDAGDARMGFKMISNDIKNYSVEFNCVTGGTLEYNSDVSKRAKDNRPTNNSLAESRAFRYDANALIHMYNHLHVAGSASPFFHTLGTKELPWLKLGVQQKNPIIEAIIGKNKISGDKTGHFFKFTAGSSWFDWINPLEAIMLAKDNDNAMNGELPGGKTRDGQSSNDTWAFDPNQEPDDEQDA